VSVTSGSVWHLPTSGRDDWSFVVARSFLAAVNAGASDTVLATLWALADADDVTVEQLVGAIPLGVEAGVHSFAVVSMPGAPDQSAGDRVVTVVVRGAAVVDLFSVGGARRFGAGAVEPWMLADFRSVTAVVIGGDDQPTAPVPRSGAGSLPVNSGIVVAERLLWSLAPVAFSRAAHESGHTAPRALAPETSAEAPHDLDATIVTARERQVASSPLDDETVLISRSGSRVAPAEPQNPRSAPPPAVRFRFRVASGEPQPLDSPVVIGRNPSAPRVIAGRTPRLVQVESPDAAVSSSHLRLVHEGGAVVATDLRSTNGTLVTPLGGKRRRMRPGETLVVLPGARIDIGDGNIIEIMPAEQILGSAHSPEPGKGPA